MLTLYMAVNEPLGGPIFVDPNPWVSPSHPILNPLPFYRDADPRYPEATPF